MSSEKKIIKAEVLMEKKSKLFEKPSKEVVRNKVTPMVSERLESLLLRLKKGEYDFPLDHSIKKPIKYETFVARQLEEGCSPDELVARTATYKKEYAEFETAVKAKEEHQEKMKEKFFNDAFQALNLTDHPKKKLLAKWAWEKGLIKYPSQVVRSKIQLRMRFRFILSEIEGIISLIS